MTGLLIGINEYVIPMLFFVNSITEEYSDTVFGAGSYIIGTAYTDIFALA